jgi:hypothetical protein
VVFNADDEGSKFLGSVGTQSQITAWRNNPEAKHHL